MAIDKNSDSKVQIIASIPSQRKKCKNRIATLIALLNGDFDK